MNAQGNRRRLVALWFVGASLRTTLLALPPLLPVIGKSYRLAPASLAALANLPVVLLALSAVAAGAVSAAMGAQRAVLVGLVLVAAGGAARGFAGSAPSLFVLTAAMGLGIAVAQTGLPTLAAEWFPQKVGLATAVYGNGIMVAEAAAAGLTLPLFSLFGGSFRLIFAFWSLPVLLGIFLTGGGRRAALSPGRVPKRPRRPVWRDGRTWALGMTQAVGSATYFAANALLPGYLSATGHKADLLTALTVLNTAQLPASVMFLAASERMMRPGAVVGFGTACVAALGVTPYASGPLLILATGIAGFSSAIVLLGSLALAPVLGGADEAAQLSGGMFALAYSLSFLAPVAGGLLWQASGIPSLSFLPPVAVGVLGVSVMAGVLGRQIRAQRASVPPGMGT